MQTGIARAIGLALAAAVLGGAGEAPRIEIVAFGIYGRSAEAGPLPAQYQRHSIVDVSLMRMPRLIRRTDRIEARMCLRFGLQYRAIGLAPNRPAVAEVRVDHPPLTRPDGRRSTEDTYQVPLGAGIGWTGLDFDETWEMAPGTWTFSLLYAGRMTATQRFTVVAAPADAKALRSCEPPVA